MIELASSAGHWLADLQGGRPCPDCLHRRLLGAGFTVEGAPHPADESGLPPGAADAVDPARGGTASVVRYTEDTMDTHLLLVDPGCPACRDAPLDGEGTAVPPETLIDAATGIVSFLRWFDPLADEGALCHAALGRLHLQPDAVPAFVSGSGFDAESAGLSFLGEAAERWSALHPDAAGLRWASLPELDRMAVEPLAVQGWDRDQLDSAGYEPLASDQPIAWIEGACLTSGRPCYLPAASVFLDRPGGSAEPNWAPLMSHGLAAHWTIEDAYAAAAAELIERHFLIRAWHGNSFGSKISAAHCDDLLLRLSRRGIANDLYRLSDPPMLPVVLAVLQGDTFPFVAIGTAARPDCGTAAHRAICEAAALWQGLGAEQEALAGGGELPLRGQPIDHALYYAEKGRAEDLVARFRVASTDMTTDTGDEAEYVDPVAALQSLVDTVFAVEATTADVRICGLNVVRLVAPGLALPGYGTVGSPRGALASIGLPASASPHPFA